MVILGSNVRLGLPNTFSNPTSPFTHTMLWSAQRLVELFCFLWVLAGSPFSPKENKGAEGFRLFPFSLCSSFPFYKRKKTDWTVVLPSHFLCALSVGRKSLRLPALSLKPVLPAAPTSYSSVP